MLEHVKPEMSDAIPMARRQVEILNFYGLHLRPADRFVRLASTFQSEIRVHCHGGVFNGKSILDLTTLAAECGVKLDLEARGPDAEQAVTALAELVAAKFHEEGPDFPEDLSSTPTPAPAAPSDINSSTSTSANASFEPDPNRPSACGEGP